MKRILLIGLYLFSCICLVAQTTKTYTLEFDETDFFVTQTEDGYTIKSYKYDLMLEENTERPAIPYFITNILLPDFQEISHIASTIEPNDTIYNITLCQNPHICIVKDSSIINSQLYSYPLRKYSANVEYVKTRNIDGYHIAMFKIFPIEYDANSKILVWPSRIEINITALPTQKNAKEYTHKGTMKNLLFSILHNPDELSIPLTAYSKEEQIDYLIITSEDMKSSFQKLANWKKVKGLQTEIVTTEMISTIFDGETEQLKIKNCIHEYYMSFGTKYVLLAGDDTVIPVQGCQGSVRLGSQRFTDNTIPADIFYTCYSGAFDWNADKDNIVGEETDSISLDQSVYIARIPVESSTDANIIVNRIINYEQGHSMSKHYLKMLLTGVQCFGSWQGRSDSEITSDRMYDEYIKDYWTEGIRTRFYDTHTDFISDSLYDVTAEHLQEQLSHGFHFVNVETHGGAQFWETETASDYNCTKANTLENPYPCIITTGACLTNAFDANSNDTYVQDPCLSEAFIRNPNSGIVAYLGGSRQGIGVSNSPTSMGTSIRLTANFYRALFSGESNKFGELVAIAKSKYGSGSSPKWVCFSVNPIGDPEMNIYTDIPTDFENITYIWNETILDIDTGISNCTITVTGDENNKNHYFQTYENTSTASFSNLSEGSYVLCITKKNYRPYLLSISTDNKYIQNKLLKGNSNYAGKSIYVGSSVTNDEEEGMVIVKSGASVTMKATQNVVLDKGFFCEKGAIFEIK